MNKMKMKHFCKSRLAAALVICFCALQTQAQSTTSTIDSRSVVGKIFTGYQGWFNTQNDGAGLQWRHWYDGSSPNPHRIVFEMYPDISEYDDSDLEATPSGERNLGNLGNGDVAKLFSSYKEGVIDKHFQWMKEAEIDGAALQRFMSYTADNRRTPSDSIAVRMARAGVKHGRLLYIMYDTGAGNTDVTRLKTDWAHLVNNVKITGFPSYAHHDEKPVVCLWGVGLNSRNNDNAATAANWLEMINWLKDQGCYVIGGTPRSWRTLNGDSHTHSDFANVYKALDMLSPWVVGRFRMDGISGNATNNLIPDLAYCLEQGIEYQPVIFPGFAWSQWKTGDENPVNSHPRLEGRFAWEQFKQINNAGGKSLYLAMFDEYDEGTNWMKNATDFTNIPTNQYFLTGSADGYWLSSDYQLRVARQMSRVMKGAADPVDNISQTLPHSEGPVYYRNSFEMRESALPKPATSDNITINGVRFYRVDPGFLNAAQVSQSNTADRSTAITESNLAKSGSFVARFTGTASGASSSYYYKYADARIEVKEGMKLSFWKYAVNDRGLQTSMSLRFAGETLSTFTHLHATHPNLTDEAGIVINPGNPRGTVGAWTKHEIVIGQGDLIGKQIIGLLFGYEGTGDGNFEAYFDDILIEAIPVGAAGLSLDETTLTLNLGDKRLLTATVEPAGAVNQTVTWSSNNTNVATVNPVIGLVTEVTGISAGTATITASVADGNHTAECEVTVQEPTLEASPTQKKAGVSIYPALVKDGRITIDAMQAEDSGLLAVSIVNVQGAIVKEEFVSPKTVKPLILNLPQGVYIISVSGNKTNVKSKIIVN